MSRWTPKSLAALKEFGRAVIAEAQRKGKTVSARWGGYVGGCVCWVGSGLVAAGVKEAPMIGDWARRDLANLSSLEDHEVGDIERGFMGWVERHGGDADLYRIGQELAAELKAPLSPEPVCQDVSA